MEFLSFPFYSYWHFLVKIFECYNYRNWNYNNITKSSTVKPADFISFLSVPLSSSLCIGTESITSQSFFIIMIWLPVCLTTDHPDLLKALTAFMPEILGSFATKQSLPLLSHYLEFLSFHSSLSNSHKLHLLCYPVPL